MLGHKDVLGLDAGSQTIKIVRLQRTGPSTHVVGVAHLERDPVPETTAQQLRNLLQEKGWDHLPCVCGMRGDLISIRLLNLPPSGSVNLRRLAATHIEEFEVLAGTPTVTEFAMMKSGGQRRMILVTARVDAIMAELYVCREAGLKVLDVWPGPLALHEGCRALAPRVRAPLIHLDLSETHTQWVVGHQRTLLQVQHIPISGYALTEERRDKVNEEDLPLFRDWLNALQAAKRAFNTQYETGSLRPGGVTLSGGYHLSDQQRQTLSETLGLPVLTLEHERIVPAAAYATAYGLARAGVARKPVAISLLPPLLKNHEEERRSIKTWLFACGAFLFAALMILLSLWSEVAHSRRALAQAEDQLVARQNKDQQRTELQDLNRQLRQQVIPLRNATRNQPAMLLLMQALSESKHEEDWLVLISDAASYFRPPAETLGQEWIGPLPEAPHGGDVFQQWIVEGYTTSADLSTVRAMIERLRLYPYIFDADLLPDDRIRVDWEASTTDDDLAPRRFALEIQWAGGGGT